MTSNFGVVGFSNKNPDKPIIGSIGKYLGNGQPEIAERTGNIITFYSVVFGILAGMMTLIIKPWVFQAVSLDKQAQYYLSGMLLICSYYCIPKSMNSVIIGGILVAGGDSKFGLWCDLIVMWGIILPLGYLSVFLWQLPPITVFARTKLLKHLLPSFVTAGTSG